VSAAAVTGGGIAPGAFSQQAPRSLAPDVVRLLDAGGRAPHEAARVAGVWRLPEAAEALARLARGPGDPLLALAALAALTRLDPADGGSGVLGATGHPHPQVREHALRAVARTADAATVTAVAVRAADDVDPGVRRRAVRVLARAGDERAVPVLLRVCEGGPSAPDALRGLARLGDARAVVTLAEVFRTATDRRLRDLAGRALVRCVPAGRGVPDLWIHDWGDPGLLRATAWVLGRIGRPADVTPLLRGLAARDALLRARSADALGRLGDPAAAEPLRAALADPEPRVRANAATALGRLAVPEAAAWLGPPTADDPDRNVRAAAAAGVRRLRAEPRDTP
jgi:HEAT repeat protein